MTTRQCAAALRELVLHDTVAALIRERMQDVKAKEQGALPTSLSAPTMCIV